MPIFQVQQGTIAIPIARATVSAPNPVVYELLHGHLKPFLVHEIPRGAVGDLRNRHHWVRTLHSRSKHHGTLARTRRGYLNERGREVFREEAEVRAAAVAGGMERPVLAGTPGRGEPRENDGTVGRHEAVDELRVGQRVSVHPLHLSYHLHAAGHLVDQRWRGPLLVLRSFAVAPAV